jgi:hypothetical protein
MIDSLYSDSALRAICPAGEAICPEKLLPFVSNFNEINIFCAGIPFAIIVIKIKII